MAGGGKGTRPSRRALLVGAGVAVAACTVVGTFILVAGEPAPLRDLERAEEAGTAAERATRDLSENLDRIASNLAAGAQLSEQGAEIEQLTQRQRRSLVELADLLRGQLPSLRATTAELRATRQSSAQVAELGARQTELVERAVTALKQVRALARSAGTTSAELARQSVDGARLAEDAQRAFSEP